MITIVFFQSAYSQITVIGSSGADGSYTQLGLAFSAINGTAQTGNSIVITITGSTTETTSATLNAGAWTSLNIYPTVSGCSISGTLDAPLIDLNGVANVIFDGRVNATGSTPNLIVTNTSATVNASTIRFINDAFSNTVEYCNIKGSGTSAISGIIFFSTAVTTGNDNNTIDSNNITNAADANRPLNTIYSSGTAGFENSDLIICNNNIYDFFSRSTASYGINLAANTTTCTITGNNLYETTSFVPTASVAYTGIYINNATSANGFVITNNYIGGRSAACGGSAWAKTSVANSTFTAINLNVAIATATSVQGNVIQNFAWSNSGAAAWTGINVAAGNVNIGTVAGNTIGAATGAGSITVTGGATSASVYGINIASTGTVDCKNNIISSITASNSGSTLATNFIGINKTAVAGTTTISNNTIGDNNTANSIYVNCASTSNAQRVYGIFTAGTGSVNMIGNTIANLTNGTTNATAATTGLINGICSTNGTNTISNNTIHDLTIANANNTATNTASVGGIVLTTATLRTVSGNTIYNLSNTYNGFVGSVIGLYFSGSTGANVVSGNFIHGLSVNAFSTAAFVYGLKIASGATTYYNNIISLGGSSATTIYGIYETGAANRNNNLYFNTVYIGGNLGAGTANPSYALYSAVSTNTRNFRNNIFSNARSTTAGSSLHYAAYFAYATSSNLTLDYNDYFAPGIGGVLGYYNALDVNALPLITGKDVLSVSVDPQFANADGTTAADYAPGASIIRGTGGTGITVDYAGTTRDATPTMGVFESTLFYNVQVWGSGALKAEYTSIKAAFDAINLGTHTGAIEIKLKASTIETASAVLYQSGYGGVSNYTSVNIYPTVSGLSISGNLATPLIDFSGADNVTIDGRVNATGTTPDLIITNTSATAGASTIRFINDASTNVVNYCTIEGSSTSATSGVILFSTTTGTVGNINNTIDNNNITCSADANRPINAIYSAGTATYVNSGLAITDNNIYNIFSRSTASYGINLASNTTTCSIIGNSLYETASFIPTASVAYIGIYINNTSGNGFTVNNNYIGGQDVLCSGSPWTKTNAFNNVFTAINLSVGTTTATSIQNNVIQNFAWSNSGAAAWTGINVATGNVNIGTVTGNTIGSATGTGSIVVTGGATATNVYGINITSTGTVNCENNIIGSITADNGSTLASNLYGVNKTGSGTTIISNNIIGSTTTANSINANSASTANAQSVYGIYSSGSGTVTINTNTIANLTNGTTNTTVATTGVVNGIAATSGTTTINSNSIHDLTIANANNTTTNTAAVGGIVLTGATLKTVTGNLIYGLSNSYASFGGSVIGLYFTGNTGANIVSKNFIHSLSVNSASTTASIFGIEIAAGATTYYNNIINLGGTTATTLYGMYDVGAASQTCNLYFNTVYIGGSLGSGIGNKSYCLYSNANTNTRSFQDNIFVNARSTTSGASLHYTVYFNYAATGTLTLDYNDYYTSGTGGVLGYYNALDVTTVPLIATKDVYSKSVNPGFTNGGSTTATDYQPSAPTIVATPLAAVTTDYAGAVRSATTPTMGVYEGTITPNVEVWKSGAKQAGYTTLKTAFAAINAGTHTGALDVKIQGSTTETAAAILYQSGYGGVSSYTSINIYPIASGLSVSGSLATPLIDLNGADNVTIDGRVNATGTTKSLIISNASVSATGGTSSIRFINDATANTVKYCTLKGSETAVASGVILFSTTTGTVGNINNTIDNNNITNAADANRPLNAIYSAGTATYVNSSLTISSNNIYDFFSRSTASYGINLAGNTTACTISDNSLYETASFIPLASVAYTGISLNSTSGNGHSIIGNYIGGQAASCGGSAWDKTNTFNNTFTAINLNVGTITATNLQGNTIKNMTWSNSGAINWTGINVIAGAVNIGTSLGNTIGATTGTGSIVVTGGATATNVYGINIAGTGTVDCEYNNIGSITADNASTLATNFYGINKTATSGTITISNNTIGSTSTANSINANSASTANVQSVYGILSAGTGTLTFNNNIIANLTNSTNNAIVATAGLINGICSTSGANTITNNTIRDLSIANANTSATNTGAVIGIVLTGATLRTVTGNTIYNLSNTNASFAGNVVGLYFSGGAGGSTVSRNYIYGLSVNSASTLAALSGIKIVSGVTTYSNNIINLDGNTAVTIYGLYDTGATSQTCNLYFNTVYIGGSLSSGITNKSYALYSNASSNTRNFRNNIFDNARSTVGGASLHYAAYLNYATATNLTLDYNDYYTPGTGGMLAYYNATDIATLATVQSTIGQNLGSISGYPNFASAGGTTSASYLPGYNRLVGVAGTGITTDFTTATRAVTPTIGAFDILLSLSVEVWKSGVYQTQYPTLKGAFDKINDGTHTGLLELKLKNSTTETVAATLYQSGYSGTSSYTSINIYPTTSGLSISGNLATPLIDLNGADNVTIDGRVNATGSTKDLLISNTSVSAVGGTSTIRFINDATANAVKYSILKGSETAGASGVVLFSTATATGNDNNTIDNNSITNAADAARPLNAVYSAGTATFENDNITISNNAIYDFFSRSTASYGINLAANTTACTISGNSLYETTSFVPTASVAYMAIYLNNTSGNGYSITGNYIGGQSASCGGSALTKTNAFNNTLTAINLNVGTTTASSVQGNTIKNIAWSNSGATTWTGINIAAGAVNIGTSYGNTIGATAGTGSIVVTAAATGASVYGINIAGSGTVDCEYNNIGSITADNASALATNFFGINKTGSTGTTTISNNSIGSTTTANSINATSASTANVQSVYGILSAGTGTVTINANTIANLTNSTANSTVATTGLVNGICSTNGANTISNNIVRDLTIANANTSATNTAAVGGIVLTTATLRTVSRNTIYNLSNSYASFAGSVIGLYFSGSTGANIVSQNFIYGLSVNSASIAATLYGIKIVSGATTYSNNIINLGGTTATTIYGLYDTGAASQTCNLYFNTVYIGDTPASTTYKSFCLYSLAASNVRNFRNNIFNNSRSTTGGTSLHYAISLTANTNLTCNYNDYYANGTGGAVGAMGGVDKTFATWKTATGQDTYSCNLDPVFIVSPPSITATNYEIGVDLVGVSGTGIITDYGSASRATPPTIGAWERVMTNKWLGTTSTSWATGSNWSFYAAPATDTNITFAASPSNHCLLDADYSVNNITNGQSTYRLVTNGHKLTVKGDLNFTNGAQIDATATSSTVEFAGSAAQNIPSGAFYNNGVYNLTVNNSNNVTLNGTLNLSNVLTASSGRLDAYTNTPTIIYGGTTVQTIGSQFLSDRVTNLTINNAAGVTLNTDFTVNNLLIINPEKSLTIPPSTQLNVVGTITNNAGVSGLIIQASSTEANGSLIFYNDYSSPVLATVEMYSKAYWDMNAAAGNKYHWQYIGIPVRSVVASPTFDGSYVRKWYESGTTSAQRWVQQGNDSVLTSFKGYEICQPATKTIIFQGQLENSDYNSGQLAYTTDAAFSGQHIFANPYTAAIDIRYLTFGTQTEATVYMYNTGTFNDWTTNGGQTMTGVNSGQYIAIPQNLAGNGLPLVIPSMQGMLIKAMSASSLATFSIPYSSVVAKNTDQQRIHGTSKQSTSEKTCTMIDVKGTRYSDRLWLFTEPTCTHNFDNGWDASKIVGSALSPQLYAVESDGDYQVSSVDNMNNTLLAFQAGEDTEYTLTFTHQNAKTYYDKIYLADLFERKIQDITETGSTYSFTEKSTSLVKNRFSIVTFSCAKDTTTESSDIKITSANGTIFIQNLSSHRGKATIFDVSGRFIKEASFDANGVSVVNTGMVAGTYIVKCLTENEKIAKPIIVRD